MDSTMKEWLKACGNVTKDILKRMHFHQRTTFILQDASVDDDGGNDSNAMLESLDERQNTRCRSPPITYSGHVKDKINIYEKMSDARTADVPIRETKSIKAALQARVGYFDDFYNKSKNPDGKANVKGPRAARDKIVIYSDAAAKRKEQQIDDFILTLIEEMHTQSYYMKEATSFIKACLKVKGFKLGDVHLEAERLLLLAGLKREMLLKMVRELRFEVGPKSRPKSRIVRAEISRLSFSSDDRHKKKAVSFVVVCSNKSDMHVSHIVKEKSRTGSIDVPGRLGFGDFFVDDASVKITLYQVVCQKTIGLLQFKHEVNERRRTNSIRYKDSNLGLLVEDRVLEPLYDVLDSLEINFENLKDVRVNRQDCSSSLHGLLKLKLLEENSYDCRF